VPLLVREIRALDLALAPGELITMREQVDRTTAPQRIGATILVVFAALAVGLAAIGLYAVMVAMVAHGRRELAMRMALGADARQLRRLVLSKGVVLAAVGLTIGAGAALQLTRLLGYLLYGVSPRDPFVFGSAFAVIGLASLAACWVPARRAMRTEPLVALRDSI
jgi:putative ABC transport system permease protein